MGKRVSGARETRNSRNKPQIPFSFPFKRLPRRVLPSNLLRALWFGFVYSLGEIASKVDRNKLPEVMKQIFKLLLTRQSHTRIRTFFFYSGKCEINFSSISAIRSKAFFDSSKNIIKMIIIIIITMYHHIHNRGRYEYISKHWLTMQ